MKPSVKAELDRCARDLERSVGVVEELGECGTQPGTESPHALSEVAKKLFGMKPIPLDPASFSWVPVTPAPPQSKPTAQEVWDHVVGTALPPLPGSEPPPDLGKVLKNLGVGPSVDVTAKMPPSDPASLSAWLDVLARKNEAEKRKRKGK